VMGGCVCGTGYGLWCRDVVVAVVCDTRSARYERFDAVGCCVVCTIVGDGCLFCFSERVEQLSLWYGLCELYVAIPWIENCVTCSCDCSSDSVLNCHRPAGKDDRQRELFQLF